jgi:hypothetical protein
MSRSTINQQLHINDGGGLHIPIATGNFVTSAVNIEEHRRLSFTIGIQTSPTGSFGPGATQTGGFTGILLVQTTNEIPKCNGSTGTQQAGAGRQPGTNGYTGALYWTTVATAGINNNVTIAQIDITDVGASWVRVAFNQTTASGVTATGTLGGTGSMHVFLTAKNT